MQRKRHLPTINDAQKAFSRIPRHLILAFAAACIFFVIFHAGFFDDRMVNEDYQHYMIFNLQRVNIGRVFDYYLVTNYVNSWTIGCAACLYLSLAAVLTVDLFRIRTKIGVVLAAALMISMPALSYMFAFMAWSPIYGRYIFLSVLAVWLADRRKWSFIPATLVFTLAMGVWQASVIAAAVLCLLTLLRDILFAEELDYKKLLFKALRFLIMGVVGILLYLLIWKLYRSVTGISQSDYRGMNQLGQFSLMQLLEGMKQSYKDFIGFFFGERFFYVSSLQKAAYGCFFAVCVFSLIFACVRDFRRIPGVAVCLLLLPLAVGAIEILAPLEDTDTLMIYSIVFILVMSLRMAENMLPENGIGTVASWLLVASMTVTCFSNLDITSGLYVKAETFHEHTAAYENRLLDRIESTPGYYPGIPVAIVWQGTHDYKGIGADKFPRIINDRGLWFSYVGAYTNAQKKTIHLIEGYTGVSLNAANSVQVQKVRSSPEFREMKAYPLDGSTQVIDGILTVNMIYREVVVLQAGERAVLLDYVDHAPTGEKTSYAWYVYKDGEQVPELCRGYEEKSAYLVELPEDGTYTFRGFCVQGENKKSVAGSAVVVKNGAIEEDEELRQIDPEEAASLARREVEVGVTIYGGRAVKLTMIDNELNAGPEYSYAWYVYKDGERIKELDRPYRFDPEYDLILDEDGIYQFKLFYRIGNEKKSVMSKSYKITVETESGEEAAA